MKQSKQAIIEKENWNKYFQESLEGEGQEHENTYWWQLADSHATDLVKMLFKHRPPISILELGCGSGSTSFLVADQVPTKALYLVDISSKALEFARSIQKKYSVSHVHYIEEDLLKLSLPNQCDLVWNVGLIEHYNRSEITEIVKKMYDLTNQNGFMIIGIPNRNSPPVLKAALLGSKFGTKFLPFIPGYRNTTEILYRNNEIKNIIHEVTGQMVQIEYVGSPLFVSTPSWIVKTCNKIMRGSALSFLTFFIVKKTLK